MDNKNQKKQRKRGELAKDILKILGKSKTLTVAEMVAGYLDYLVMSPRPHSKYNPKPYVVRAIDKLKDTGLIYYQTKDGKRYPRLTQDGKAELGRYLAREKFIKKPRWWDKKWRVLIFDIKEYKKGVRDKLRWELRKLGFVRLQDSVWVYPYDCEEVAVMLKSYFKLGGEVLYMVVEKIENDRWLKEEFELNEYI